MEHMDHSVTTYEGQETVSRHRHEAANAIDMEVDRYARNFDPILRYFEE